jgi:S-adenosylmethionine decarboxylase proenzyme
MKITEIIADFAGCENKFLTSRELVRKCLLESIKISGANILGEFFYKFKKGGKGVTGVIILAESHVSIHTWPEKGYAAVDIFTCGNIDANTIFKNLKEKFSPSKIKFKKINRIF